MIFIAFLWNHVFSEQFSDYYSEPVSHLIEGSSEQRILLDPLNYFVKDTVFRNMSGSLAPIHIIYFYNLNMLIVDCLFHNCYTTNNGGGIYFSCADRGSFTIKRVCGSFCSTQTNFYGQFLHSSVPYTNRSMIQLLTLEKCAGSITTRYSALYISGGNLTFVENNISKCYSYQCSAFNLNSMQAFHARYCTFYANSAVYSMCMYFSYILYSNIQYSNILNNNSPSSDAVITIVNYPLNATNCIFMYNFHTLFKSTNTQFYLFSGWLFHGSSIYTTGTLITSGVYNNNLETQTIVINHFSTYGCNPQAFAQDISPCQTIPHPPTPYQSIPPDCLISGSLSGLNTISSFFSMITLAIFPFFLTK